MDYITLLKNGMPVFCAVLLFACGGGDSGPGDITYTGKTGKAVLTASNDDAFGTTMLEGSSNSNSSNPFFSVTSGSRHAKKNLSLLETLAGQFKADITGTVSSAKNTDTAVAITSTSPLNGPCGGDLSVSGGESSGSVAYNNYCVGDINGYNVTFNGSMSYTFAGTQTSYEITIKYSRFSITVKTPTDSWTESGSGEMKIVFANGAISVSYTSYFERDGKVYKIENLTLDNGVIEGRLYHPDYGYVEISTALNEPFIEQSSTGEYCGGILQINGINSNGETVVSTMTVSADCSEYTMVHEAGVADPVAWH